MATRPNQRALSIELEALFDRSQKLLANSVPTILRTNKSNLKSRYFSFVKVTLRAYVDANGRVPDRFTESRCR